MYMSRKISENMSEAAWENAFMQERPRLRFFKPTATFWEHLKKVQADNEIMMFIDCGTGNGELPTEARENHDIKMAGCDIAKRQGNTVSEAQIMPAHHMPFNHEVWAMTCRPDHGGWARALLEKCQAESSGFIYVGLRKNMAFDLGDHMMETPFDTYEDCGEEGEQMLVFKPNENPAITGDPLQDMLNRFKREDDEDDVEEFQGSGKHRWECDCGHTQMFRQPELPQENYNSEQNEDMECTECDDDMWFDEV